MTITIPNIFATLIAKNSVRSAWRTFVQAFLGLFGISLLRFLQDVTSWGNGGHGVTFPAVGVLGKAGVSALAAAVIAVISGIHNGVEAATGSALPLLPKPDPIASQVTVVAEPIDVGPVAAPVTVQPVSVDPAPVAPVDVPAPAPVVVPDPAPVAAPVTVLPTAPLPTVDPAVSTDQGGAVPFDTTPGA